MTKATTASWTKLSFWLGDGASPQGFTSAVCGMTTKSFSISADTSNVNVPDCTDPDLPSWVERVVRSLSAGWNGSGIMAEQNFETYRDWMLSGEARDALVVLDISNAKKGYFSGRFVLTQFELTGNDGDGKITFASQVQSDGEIVWIDGAVPA